MGFGAATPPQSICSIFISFACLEKTMYRHFWHPDYLVEAVANYDEVDCLHLFIYEGLHKEMGSRYPDIQTM